MRSGSPGPRSAVSASPRTASPARQRRALRQATLERLEDRRLLAYTFSIAGTVGTATSNNVADKLFLRTTGALIAHSTDGVTFSTDWSGTGTTLAALASSTVNVLPGTANAHSVTLGTPAIPASTLLARINLQQGGPSNNLVIDDSGSSVVSTYTYNGAAATITGPGINVGLSATPQGGGDTFRGGSGGNIFNVQSTYASGGTGEALAIVGGAGNDTVNVQSTSSTAPGAALTIDLLGGSGNSVNVGTGLASLQGVGSPVTVNDTGGLTNLTINDSVDASARSVTVTATSVTGLAPAAINYAGAALNALTIDGGSGGNTFTVNAIPASITTGLFSGAGNDTTNVFGTSVGSSLNLDSQAGANSVVLGGSAVAPLGIRNLLGSSVTISPTGGTTALTLDDSQDTTARTATITGSTVTGLAPATINYVAPASLGGNGVNAITVNGGTGGNTFTANTTAANATTRINAGSGSDTTTVFGTGVGSVLNLDGQAGTNVVTLGGNAVAPLGLRNFLGSSVTVSPTGGTTAATLDDSQDTTARTATMTGSTVTGLAPATINYVAPSSPGGNGVNTLSVNGGAGGNRFNVNTTAANATTQINAGTGNDTTNVLGTGVGSILNLDGQAGANVVTLGGNAVAPLGLQNFLGNSVSVSPTGGTTALTLDDSQDSTTRTASITGSAVTGLAPTAINFTAPASAGGNGVNAITVRGGSGGNIFNVSGTLANSLAPTDTTLNSGLGVDTVNVQATTSTGPLHIHGQNGADVVTIGNGGSEANVLGPISVDNASSHSSLTVDASTDVSSHPNMLLQGSAVSSSTLTGLTAMPITYTGANVSVLTINTTPAGIQALSVNFGNAGNPIPVFGQPGLIFNAGADATSAPNSHLLNLQGTLPGGPFTSEVHNAENPADGAVAPHFGDVAFVTPLNNRFSLNYTGLQPVNDTAAAVNYTFNDFGYPDQSFNAVGGTAIQGFNTIQFNSTPTPANYESTNIANKTNVVFNTPPQVAGVPVAGISGFINIPTASTGLATLAFNVPLFGDNTVSIIATPPGIVTSVTGDGGEDTTNVTGKGVAQGTTLQLNGAGSSDTLDYDAGGLAATVAAGATPGQVLIALPGFGSVNVTSYEQIHLTNVGAPAIVPGPARAISSVEGFNDVDAIIGTFTLPLAAIAGAPAGFPASDFAASIDWGDPTPDLAAGNVTQDASNPSVYYISGSHTFNEQGSFTVASTIGFAGGSFTAPVNVNGTPVSYSFGPSAPVAGTAATATVIQGTIAVSVFPIVVTEGDVIASGPVATFIDAGGAGAPGEYSATVSLVNSSGLVLLVPGATIAQVGDSAQYTVTAPAFTLPEEGTYQLLVAVTDSDTPGPITVTGAAQVVVADAALTTTASANITRTEGAPISAVPLATFTDANPLSTVGDFTAVIDWGDGSPSTLGTVSGAAGGPFTVAGSHTYIEERSTPYTITVQVNDVGGSRAIATLAATVNDAALTNPVGIPVDAVEGRPLINVPVATFTDGNPNATLDDFTTTINWGDNTISTGTLTVAASTATSTTFQVLGSHTYEESGAYPIGVTVTDVGGQTFSLSLASFSQANLVSDGAVPAVVIDPNLKNSWGIVFNGASPWWVSDNATGVSTLYNGNTGAKVALTVTIPPSPNEPPGATSAPTGIVANTVATDFLVAGAGTAANFIFSTEDGTIAARNAGSLAVIKVDNNASGAVYKGLALAGSGGSNFLYATNFNSGHVDVFDRTFTPHTFSANQFTDPTLPAGYAPFGIQSIGTNLYVTYALQDADKHDDVPGPGNGYVDVYGTDGTFVQRLVSNGALNSPWGLALAPANFGAFSNDLLIGNFGDGHINAYNATTGAPLGPLTSGTPAAPVTIDGLWGLGFGNGGSAGPTNELFFAAGINDEADGLFGGITTALINPTAAMATVSDAPIHSSGASIGGTEGRSLSAFVASFNDDDPNGVVGDYTATIDWGDSTPPTTGTVSLNTASGTTFLVAGTHTYGEEGSYQVTVTIADVGGATTVANGSATIADAALTAGAAAPLTPGTGVLLSNVVVGAFTDANLGGTPSDFTATIDWGDGTPASLATVVGGVAAGAFNVEGTHTYALPGSYATRVVAIDVGGSVVSLAGTAVVTDAPLTGASRNISAVEGANTGTIVLATITDPNTLATAASLSATVNWGDGTGTFPVAVTLVGGSPTGVTFQVTGSHTYAEEGSFTVQVTATTSGGATTMTTPLSGTATVADASLSSKGASITGVEGLATATKLIATFTDSNPAGAIADFTTGTGSVIVNWGDGTAPVTLPASALTTSGSPDGVIFSVSAVHTYAEFGTYAVVVRATDKGGATTIAQGQAIIADAALTAGAAVALSPVSGVLLSNVVVGTFTDANTGGVASDFTATIDWGDGTPTSLGTVVAGAAAGAFNVEGTHTYARPGSYATRVIVTDVGGSVVSLAGTAAVTDAPLTGAARNISAVEGANTGTIVLATITDPNTLATAASLSATVNWGDGTGTFPVAVTLVGGSPTGVTFQVTGSHTYAEEGSFTVQVTATTTGGATTTTTPMSGTATVADASLSSEGATITGVEGLATATKLIATFIDSNPAGTIADFTTGNGTVIVNWGDGTAPVTLPASALTTSGSPDGVLFSVSAVHTYVEFGTYAVVVRATDTGGATTIAHSQAIIADAPLTAPAQTPVTTDTRGVAITENKPFTAVVGTFVDGNPLATVADFTSVMVNWGDGTPSSPGTVSQPGGVGTPFFVTASHVYDTSRLGVGPGTFPIVINVTDNDGSTLVINNSITVAGVLGLSLMGQLNPATDTGQSQLDAITRINQPNFFGTAEPFSTVQLLVAPAGTSDFAVLGLTQAGSSGAWSVTSNLLRDGKYKVEARSFDRAGNLTDTTQILPNATQGPLVIDTVGPKVTALSFNRINGKIDLSFQDSLSGLDQHQVIDAANYSLTRQQRRAGSYVVNVIAATPSGATGPENVVLTINNGRQIRGAIYTFTVLSGGGPTGMRDVAGNGLDGEFYGFFPSGNNLPGGNFVAGLNAVHHTIFAPRTLIGHATPVSPPGTPSTGSTIGTFNPNLPSGNPNLQGGSRLLKSSGHVRGARAVHVRASHAVHDAALAHLGGAKRHGH